MTDKPRLTSVWFSTPDENDEIHLQGMREDGSVVLVGTVDVEFPNVAREIVGALRTTGVEVDASTLDAHLATEEPVIHFMTMRVTVGPDDSEWTDLETRSSLGKYPSASFAEEFDGIAEAVTALHPRSTDASVS